MKPLNRLLTPDDICQGHAFEGEKACAVGWLHKLTDMTDSWLAIDADIRAEGGFDGCISIWNDNSSKEVVASVLNKVFLRHGIIKLEGGHANA